MKKRTVGWALAAAVALTPVMAWANAGKEGYYGHGHMMGGGMGHWLWGPLMMILAVAAIVAIVVLVVRWMGGPPGTGHAPQGPTTKSPVRHPQGTLRPGRDRHQGIRGAPQGARRLSKSRANGTVRDDAFAYKKMP